MDGSWLWEQLTLSPLRAGFWLVLSFLLAGVTTGVTRLIAPELERIARLVRWVQLPYIGLILGGLSPRLMGLTELDWAVGFSIGVVLLFAMLILLALMRIWLHTDQELPPSRATRTGTPHSGAPIQSASSGLLLFESSAQEFHWCFLRGAVWDLLLSLPSAPESPQYWAVWIGAALALPGISIQRKPISDRLSTALILMTTSSLFLYTRNFWLCWLLHLCIRIILQWRQPTRQRTI